MTAEVPEHDHPALAYGVVLLVVFLLFVGALVVHGVYVARHDLRCSAYVKPPKGCTP